MTCMPAVVATPVSAQVPMAHHLPHASAMEAMVRARVNPPASDTGNEQWKQDLRKANAFLRDKIDRAAEEWPRHDNEGGTFRMGRAAKAYAPI